MVTEERTKAVQFVGEAVHPSTSLTLRSGRTGRTVTQSEPVHAEPVAARTANGAIE